jgi:UDP-4-amino-4,6-dideoxy-N-acetyl-beta-L-altrosamine transaminase
VNNKPNFLGYGRQNLSEEDIESVVDVLRSDFLTQGPVLEQFEQALVDYTGAKYAVAVTSGTAGLHLACLAAATRKKSRGVTSTMSFIASANCLLYCGGSVDLLDVNLQTLNIDPDGLDNYLKDNEVDIVIPVHFSGLAADNDKIQNLSGDRVIIEDACHSLGGTYDNGNSVGCGDYSDMSVFSFHPVKSITTGEGGAVLTNDPDLAERLAMLRSHGIEKNREKLEEVISKTGETAPWLYDQVTLGYNYRMTELQAALGLSQLQKLDSFVEKRRKIAKIYDEEFAKLPVDIPQSNAEFRARSALHLYQLHVDWKQFDFTRSDFMEKLRNLGIGSQVHYIPIHKQSFYARHGAKMPDSFVNSEMHYYKCISLPIHPGMALNDIERVVHAVKDSLIK